MDGIRHFRIIKSLSSDPNFDRHGTESDVKALEKAFVFTHRFKVHLNLQGKVTTNGAKLDMIDYVGKLVSIRPKFIAIFIMSHGKKNNWYFRSNHQTNI